MTTPSPPSVAAPSGQISAVLVGPGELPALPRSLTLLSERALQYLVGSFPIPPYLLPIYQAAGIEYGVPWQVLAAINEAETNFGRNLAVSSAGAEGWMQFLPSTWARFGVAADDRRPNPYDPVDAIFAAARYLRAAGAATDLSRAIFAYNHARWYVNSVELRTKLLQALPQGLIDGLNGLVQARFPVAGHLGGDATRPQLHIVIAGRQGVRLAAPASAPVISPADARVLAIGERSGLGRYVTVEDSYGDRFTLGGLGAVERLYPVLIPRPESAAAVAARLDLGRSAELTRPLERWPLTATAGTQTAAAPRPPVATSPAPKVRLFADPARRASFAAGGAAQLQGAAAAYAASVTSLTAGRSGDVLSRALRLAPGRFSLAPLRPGAIVAAGTVLGHVEGGRAPSISLQVVPSGSRAPVDPTAIVAGWQLLGRLTAGGSVLGGLEQATAYDSRNPTLGQLLMAGRGTLAASVLGNPSIELTACDRAAIRAGRVDRRALAAVAFLAYSRLAPTVSSLACGVPVGVPPEVRITALAGTAVAGHQRPGGIVDLAVRQLLGLQGPLRPQRIVSLRSYPWQPAALSLPDHASVLELDYAAPRRLAGGPLTRTVGSDDWQLLIRRLGQLAVPMP